MASFARFTVSTLAMSPLIWSVATAQLTPNVFETSLVMTGPSPPSSSTTFASSQYAAFEKGVASAFAAKLPEAVTSSRCVVSFRDQSTPAPDPAASSITCTVSTMVKTATVSVYPTYKSLVDYGANVSSTSFKNDLLWPIRSSFATAFDLDNSKINAVSMVNSAPCRNSQLTNPVTAIPGDDLTCNTADVNNGREAGFALLITVGSPTMRQGIYDATCQTLILNTVECARKVTAVLDNSGKVVALTVRGQPSPVSSMMNVINGINRVYGNLPYRLKPSLDAPDVDAVILRDPETEGLIYIGESVECTMTDYLWLLGLIIFAPIFYIILWTAYRCGRRHGKHKQEAKFTALENTEEAKAAREAAEQQQMQQQLQQQQQLQLQQMQQDSLRLQLAQSMGHSIGGMGMSDASNAYSPQGALNGQQQLYYQQQLLAQQQQQQQQLAMQQAYAQAMQQQAYQHQQQEQLLQQQSQDQHVWGQ